MQRDFHIKFPLWSVHTLSLKTSVPRRSNWHRCGPIKKVLVWFTVVNFTNEEFPQNNDWHRVPTKLVQHSAYRVAHMGARASNHIIDLVWLNRWPNPLGTKGVFYLFKIHMISTISTYLRIVKMKKLQPAGSGSNPSYSSLYCSVYCCAELTFFPVHTDVQRRRWRYF